jgi:hypothetical protein
MLPPKLDWATALEDRKKLKDKKKEDKKQNDRGRTLRDRRTTINAPKERAQGPLMEPQERVPS